MKKPKVIAEPGAQERFEQTVRAMLNTPRKPHKPLKAKRRKAAKS
jgi:hypothetical protein